MQDAPPSPPFPSNPCRAYTNYSFVDISAWLDYPVTVGPVPGNSPSGKYMYEFDCTGNRTRCGKGVSVCQWDPAGPALYSVGGSATNALFFASGYNNAPEKLNLTISYPSNALGQASFRVRVEPRVKKPTIETPSLVEDTSVAWNQYNFDIVVPCPITGDSGAKQQC